MFDTSLYSNSLSCRVIPLLYFQESGGKDEVEPFSLDDDHDYDTFTITPKYSAQELEIINAAIRQGRQEAELAKQRQDAST